MINVFDPDSIYMQCVGVCPYIWDVLQAQTCDGGVCGCRGWCWLGGSTQCQCVCLLLPV